MVDTYNILVLGPTKSGKTVFLISMFNNLMLQNDTTQFFLEPESEKQRVKLIRMYTELENSDDNPWPPSNIEGEIVEWNFKVGVRISPRQTIFAPLRFRYIDYAGGDYTKGNENLVSEMDRAHAVLILLDGERICQFMQGQRNSNYLEWIMHIKRAMNFVGTTHRGPVQLVITKWDLVEWQHHKLSAIIDKLYNEIREFKHVIDERFGKEDGNTITRIIPTSAVGADFVNPHIDEEHNITSVRVPGAFPSPFQIEMPIACVLPDLFRDEMNIRTKLEEVERDRKIEASEGPELWELLLEIVGNSIDKLRQRLSSPLALLSNDALIKLAEILKRPAQQTRVEAEKTRKEMELTREKSLARIANEKDALNHVLGSFLYIEALLIEHFPESDLSHLA